jgi:hypothetical protein
MIYFILRIKQLNLCLEVSLIDTSERHLSDTSSDMFDTPISEFPFIDTHVGRPFTDLFEAVIPEDTGWSHNEPLGNISSSFKSSLSFGIIFFESCFIAKEIVSIICYPSRIFA